VVAAAKQCAPASPIREHHVEPDAASHRRLAVALADLDVGGAEAAKAVCPLPSEQRADYKLLPRL
jgi:hypothetical protein